MEIFAKDLLLEIGANPDSFGTLAGRYPVTYCHAGLPPGRVKRVASNYFDLYCPTRPADIYEISGSTKRKVFRYRTGYIAFNPPKGEWHAMWESRIEGFSLYIQPEILQNIAYQTFNELPSEQDWRLVLSDYVPSIAYLALDIGSQAITGYPAGVPFVEQQMTTLLSLLARRFCKSETRDTALVGIHSAQVLRAVQYISTHINEKISVDSIAIAAASSAPHLNRLFRAETGVSIWQYVQNKRNQHPIQETG